MRLSPEQLLLSALRLKADRVTASNSTGRACSNVTAKLPPSGLACFRALEQRYSQLAHRKMDEDRGLGYVKRYPGSSPRSAPASQKNGCRKLQPLAAAASDSGQKARLQLLLDNLEYSKTTCELYRLAIQVVSNPKPSQNRRQADALAQLRKSS